MVFLKKAFINLNYRIIIKFKSNNFYHGFRYAHQNASITDSISTKKPSKHLVFDNRSPSFEDFLRSAASKKMLRDTSVIDKDDKSSNQNNENGTLDKNMGSQTINTIPEKIPYLDMTMDINSIKNLGENTKYYLEVYGCQMNVNDAEILMSIMDNTGYQKTEKLEEAKIIFLVTCAIRDRAENKIWQRLNVLKSINSKLGQDRRPLIGVLGCMAERLKTKLLETDKMVDIVCGPDAYRSIPHLISLAIQTSQGVANVMLSADETYADIMPVRLHKGINSASLSIMRGCNNMCSFCIVPYTRY
ncbi:hypothetical protein Glove_146g71 [Diversispora epigaea]|uniref:MTTase N-terminal domain-containing protein n=1 Tax=Diversispora epigaea TaxID=1348612 RepID=A0A397IYH8_9GLOM|nr:hypothetical protein Glove_146g71 [Diversispora epigaea]